MRTVGPAGPINEKTYPAQSALTRGYAVKAGTVDGTCTAITAAGQRSIGIASSDVATIGNPAAIVRHGDTPAIAGGAFAVGDYLKVDAVGRLVVIAAAAGEEIIARAESTATALGDEVLVFVIPGVR